MRPLSFARTPIIRTIFEALIEYLETQINVLNCIEKRR